jgi:hypothetical protein
MLCRFYWKPKFTMKCKLCNQEKKLIKAHIFPKSLYRPLLAGGQPLSVLSTSPASHPYKSRIGFYDTEILCQECEKIFSPWDDYVQKILLAEPKEKDYLINNDQKFAIKMDVDYAKLKLFFISLLWRASVSKFYFFQKIKLEPFEQKLKNMILKGDPGDAETFAVTLAKFEDPLGMIMPDPLRHRFDDVNYCLFYLAGYVAYIKTDKRPSAEFLKDLVMNPDRPLIIILRDLKRSKEFPLMKKVAKMWPAKLAK